LIKSKRVVEWIKTALIVLLTASAMLLGRRTGLFNDFFRTIPFFGSVAELMRGSTGTAQRGSATIKEAARPLTVVITSEEGGRCGMKYDTDARNDAYDRTSSIFGEALGSASNPSEVSESEWREALTGPGVFYEYVVPVRLSVLAGWVEARMPETLDDILIRRIFLAFGEDRSRIFYEDIARNLFFGADTASAAGKALELATYSANEAVFAFETGIKAAENAPYMLIVSEREHPAVRVASAGNAEELLEIALAAFDHINEGYTTYYDSRGTLVCVGTQFNIRVDTNGGVRYRRTDGLPPEGVQPERSEQTLGISEMIEYARTITADTVGGNCGDAEVFFESAEDGADGSCTVSFGYYIAGGRLHLQGDGHAAIITFRSGIVVDIELYFRDYSLTDELSRLLPGRLAFAAAGGEFLLCYPDNGQETLLPVWVRYSY